MGVVSWSFVCSDHYISTYERCGLLELIDLLQAVFFSAGSQALLNFKLFYFVEALLVFVDFNGFPVQSNVL